MSITKIALSNFRNIRKKTFEFSPDTTVIVGDNASGKTNVLEAIYLLATGKSFRARVEEEMISYDAEIARISAELGIKNYELGRNAKNTKLEVVLTRGEISVGEDPDKKERVPKKKLLVNGVSRRLFNFAGNFKIVLFGPWDLDLVTKSPSARRRFLDSVLSQVDREYGRASLSYEKGLRQRNRLLWRIREEGLSRSQLLFWNNLLIKNGDYISIKRREFVDFANRTSDFPSRHRHAQALAGGNAQDFSLEYDKSAISEARLEQYAREEVAAATTLVGPHRDDFCFRLRKNKKARNLSKFGSRGEQRMGTLWLKLAELKFIEAIPLRPGVHRDFEGQGKPTLLLDDIFSELDHEHRDIVMEVAKELGQTIITTADPHFVENFSKVQIINL